MSEDEWMEDFLEEYAGTKRYADTPNRPGKRPKGYKKNPVARLLKSKRSRLTPVTRSLKKKGGTRTSRAWEISPQRLRYPSSSKSRSRSVSRTPSTRSLSDASMKSFASSKKASFELDAYPSKVRHNLTRKNARKTMPRGGKPYARRKTMRKPKGAYRGAILPKWAKGETKHILMNDSCTINGTSVPGTTDGNGFTAHSSETAMNIGAIKSWSMNPCKQGTAADSRNGRSIDGTYLRVQGHIRNASDVGTNGQHGNQGKSYVRMLVLAVKGHQAVPSSTNSSTSVTFDGTRLAAPLITTQLFKRIDGSVVGFEVPSSSGGSGAAAVRTLQLPVNKGLYTVLADQKFQLANETESFGSSDRLFDLKMKLKQRTQFGDEHSDSFEKNQLVFVVMTVDPQCADSAPSGTPIKIEFESKYSYKDF